MTTAKRIEMRRYGPPEVLELVERPLPPLAPDEVRFQLAAAAVNRLDLEIRSGRKPIRAAEPFPYTPGVEAAGVVSEIGAEVTGLVPGDPVITMMQQLGGDRGERPGGYQEVVTVPADAVAKVPEEIPLEEIAALGLAAVTALNGLRRLEPPAGATVLVHGASGGVGSAAVRLAKAEGLRVLATTTRAIKREYLESLGVDKVVPLDELDARVPDRSIDAVLDLVGGEVFRTSVAKLRRRGRLCLLGNAAGEQLCLYAGDLLRELTLSGYSSESLTGPELRQDIAQLCAWLASGTIAAPAYERLPLAEAAAAHARLEAGAVTGRLLLVP